MTNSRMWMVRAGESAALVDEYLKHGLVSVGWLQGESMAELRDRQQLERALRRRYPELSDGQIRSGVTQAGKFLFDFRPDDRVITYDPRTRVYHVGRIASSYRYRPELRLDAPDAIHEQTRDVEWTGKVNRDDLSIAARNSLGAIMTIFAMNDDVRAEIDALLQGKVPEAPTPTRESANLEDVRENALETAREFIKDKLLALGWDEMQELVAGILRAMGYKTRVSAKGPDRGKDIMASPDGLGLESPRIIVEVKHRRNEQIGASQMRSFIGGLRQSDRGLYVSTGGFAKDAKYEADRAAMPVTLLSLDDVAQLLIDNYEATDTETRALVPLTRVYWPAG